jgi:glycine/D-amino acid oxidase-like deaminating enzyme
MADVLVLGGGICGLATAILLVRDGHAVTVVERDAEPLPESAAAAAGTPGHGRASPSFASRTTSCPVSA